MSYKINVLEKNFKVPNVLHTAMLTCMDSGKTSELFYMIPC